MFEGAQRAIEKRIKDNWSATPVKWDGKPMKHNQPQYIAPVIEPTVGNLQTLGQNFRERQTGTLIIQIFVARNIGTNQIRRHADALAADFRNVNVAMTDSNSETGTIYFRTPFLTRSRFRDSDLLQLNLNCPFETRKMWSPAAAQILQGDEGQNLLGDEGQTLFGDAT